MEASDDILTIKIDRKELHVLCVWAERWAHAVPLEDRQRAVDILYPIVKKIQDQIAVKEPLTLMDEAIQALH